MKGVGPIAAVTSLAVTISRPKGVGANPATDDCTPNGIPMTVIHRARPLTT